MPNISFVLNGEETTVSVASGKPLLWVLREDANLLGTKYGCGRGICGSCTILLDGRPVRSCVLPIEAVNGKNVGHH